jgi:hypothetical protein
VEEPLVDSVRTALSSAITNSAPPIPEFQDTESRLKYLRWLGAMSERLKKKKPEWDVRREFLQTVWYESKRAGLDVSLVLDAGVGRWRRWQALSHANQFAFWLRDLASLSRAGAW